MASRVRPSGSVPNATAATPPVWPVSGSPTGVPVAGSHNRTVPSSLPVASRVRPSGSVPNATAVTAPVWPVSGSPTGVPVAGSHNRTVPSQLPVASRVRPSGSAPNATAVTASVWPVSGSPTGVPVTGSHNRTVPSSLPVASRVRPSDSVPNATAATGSVWPVKETWGVTRRNRHHRSAGSAASGTASPSRWAARSRTSRRAPGSTAARSPPATIATVIAAGSPSCPNPVRSASAFTDSGSNASNTTVSSASRSHNPAAPTCSAR